MALTARTFVDDPQCLMVAWVDETKQAGAIGQVDVTNRTTDRAFTAYAVYQGAVVTSPLIGPGETFTQTFRGNQARAGDVSETGYYG